MKRIIAAYQWHVFRDDCANGCLRVAQTVALESDPPVRPSRKKRAVACLVKVLQQPFLKITSYVNSISNQSRRVFS